MNLIEVLISLLIIGMSASLLINFENVFSKLYFTSNKDFKQTLYLHNALIDKEYLNYIEPAYRRVKIDIITLPNIPNPFYRARLDEKVFYEAR